LNLGGRGYRWWQVNLGGRTRAWKVDPADARLSGMIPRANRYHFPHRKADAAYSVATTIGMGTPRSCVCSSGRPEKWISWGALVHDPFFGKSVSLQGVALRRSVDFGERATHHYFRVSQDYKEIRLSQSVHEQGYCTVMVDCSKQPNVY